MEENLEKFYESLVANEIEELLKFVLDKKNRIYMNMKVDPDEVWELELLNPLEHKLAMIFAHLVNENRKTTQKSELQSQENPETQN